MISSLALRYSIELAIIVPAAVIAILPVYYSRSIERKYLFGILGILFAVVIGGGSLFCSTFDFASNILAFPVMVVLFTAYQFCFDLSFTKKLFSFANAVYLCGFCTTYNTFLTAPLELDNPYPVYTITAGLIDLGMAAFVGGIFSRTLFVRFPELFENDSLDSAWNTLSLAPILAAAVVIWMKPVSVENVMTGRLRIVCLVVLPVIPLFSLFLYQILWWLSKKMTERADLQRSLDMMQMIEKQYRQTRCYLNETSNARHDFRQHIHVIKEYLQAGEYDKLREYIAPISEAADCSYKMICINQAVDALANHYDGIANSKGVTINWNVNTEDILPVRESDACAVIGNLVENAIRAASLHTGEDKVVNVRIGILQKETLVISVDNPYSGTLTFDKTGLPLSSRPDHGIGLRSVRNIVERYKGSMEIETHDQIFSVSILAYAPDQQS